ncbi:MAG: alpha/beta fold hydrolase [Arenicellales bacterium]
MMKNLLYIFWLGCGFLFIQHHTLLADELPSEVKTVQVNGYDMSYVERGSGTPVIFVHGSLSDYRTWLPLLDDFSETNRAISLSLRHYYPEKWDGKEGEISLQQHADDIAAFIEKLNLGPAFIIGHSRGAAVAMLMASQHPQLASRLILADPSPLASMLPEDADLQAAEKVRSELITDIMKHYRAGDTESALKEFVNFVAGSDVWDKTPDKIRNVLRDNSWTLTSMQQDIETLFTCANASGITAPVLLVTGDRSASRYRSMHSALEPCMAEVSKVTIADAGHMMFQSNPTEFTFEVQYFISPE